MSTLNVRVGSVASSDTENARVIGKKSRGWALTQVKGQDLQITHVASGLALPRPLAWKNQYVKDLFKKLPNVTGKTLEQVVDMRPELSKLAREVVGLPW